LSPLYQGPALVLDEYNEIWHEQGVEAAQAYLNDLIARGVVKVIPRQGRGWKRRARAALAVNHAR
jgi:hypothetical protein